MDASIKCEYQPNTDCFHISIIAEHLGVHDEVDIHRDRFLAFLDSVTNGGYKDMIGIETLAQLKAEWEKEYHISLIR